MVRQVVLEATTNGKVLNWENVIFKERKDPFQLKSQKQHQFRAHSLSQL